MIRRPILTIALSSLIMSVSLIVGILNNANPAPIAAKHGHETHVLIRVTNVVDLGIAENTILAKTGGWSEGTQITSIEGPTQTRR